MRFNGLTIALASFGTAATISAQAALWIADYGYDSGWRVDLHPRFMVDVNRDRKADVVAFGGDGVYVSLSTGTSFTPRSAWVLGYGSDAAAGGWQVTRHPRMLGDVNGDGRPDVVGFASGGVWVSLNTGSSFTPGTQWLTGSFGFDSGWRVENHLRFLADVNGDNRADVVGFGDWGVYVSLSGGGAFSTPTLALPDFSYHAGGWRNELHPRFMADVNGDGRADIVGFSDVGVHVSMSLGNGRFSPAQQWSYEFGYNTGWRVDRHPRFVQDVNGDGRADITGFHDNGVSVALCSNTSASFHPATPFSRSFGYNEGWRVDLHPRMVVRDTSGIYPRIVGVASTGARVQRFPVPREIIQHWTCQFGTDYGWMVDRHPRMVVDVTGDDEPDMVGFGNAGVYVMNYPNAQAYGTTCDGPLEGAVGIPDCNRRWLLLRVPGTTAITGMFVIGASRTDLPLNPSCRLLASTDILLAPTTWNLRVELQLQVPSFIQTPLYAQFVGVTPINFVMSTNGVELRF